MQGMAKRMEAGGEGLPAEAGSAAWMQFMLFQQRSAATLKAAQKGTRTVFMQVRTFRSGVVCVAAGAIMLLWDVSGTW